MKFRLIPETLYLCVNILDRYLSSEVQVQRQKLQLVGVTALLVACKYEEIYPPEVKDCVYITDRAYTRQDVLDMERDIVKKLEFKFTVPTGYPFLKRFLHITKASKPICHLANYYMERMLQEYCSLSYRPSLVAAAAVCLALNNPDVLEYDLQIESPIGVVSFLWFLVVSRRVRYVSQYSFSPLSCPALASAGCAGRLFWIPGKRHHRSSSCGCQQGQRRGSHVFSPRAYIRQTKI